METEKDLLIEFKACQSENHSSPFPKEKVPIQFFVKDPQDPNSKMSKICSHCRNNIQLTPQYRWI